MGSRWGWPKDSKKAPRLATRTAPETGYVKESLTDQHLEIRTAMPKEKKLVSSLAALLALVVYLARSTGKRLVTSKARYLAWNLGASKGSRWGLW